MKYLKITLTKKEKKRFFSKILIDPISKCWNWTHCRDKFGYGFFRYKGNTYRVHRFIMATFNKIPTAKYGKDIPVFDHPTSEGWNGQGYFPTVGDIRITPKYQAFLGDTARYFGVDPVDVSPQGIGRISEHTRKYSEKSNFEH